MNRDSYSVVRAIVGSAIVFVVSIGAVAVFYWVQGDAVDEPVVSEHPLFDEYTKLKEEGRFVVLAEDFESYTPNASKVEQYVKRGTIKVNSLIAKAYIYVDVSVDNGQKLTVFDSIYLRINGYGGHILRNLSEKVSLNQTTHLLYDLREVPFLWGIPYDEARKPNFTNWLEIINQYLDTEAGISYETFISSMRQGGRINEISIAYECGGEDITEVNCLEIE